MGTRKGGISAGALKANEVMQLWVLEMSVMEDPFGTCMWKFLTTPSQWNRQLFTERKEKIALVIRVITRRDSWENSR